MKKYLSIFILAFTVVGCSNESDLAQPKKEVDVTLDYSFIESGSMSRAGSNIYTNFYNKYIKTKQLTPTCYSLTFKNLETGAVAVIRGRWEKKDGIKLLEGEYEVTGISYPSGNSKLEECISDTLYLNFKENININNNSNHITLTAIYDSYMLLFDAPNTNSIYYCINENLSNDHFRLPKDNEVFHAFIHSFYWKGNLSPNNIFIYRKDGKYSSITLDNIPFEKGKYYYFNDINNSFNIPPMEEGK